jgi:bifunctional aspartokinase / homoserine dehydrogenase 1
MKKTSAPTGKGTLVMKFGGTSVGTTKAMHQAVSIVQNEKPEWMNIIVVTSALDGVTDTLLRMASQVSSNQLGVLKDAASELIHRHDEIADNLIPAEILRAQVKREIHEIIDHVVNLCQAISALGECTPRVRDIIASAGERMSVRLLAAAIQSVDVPANVVEAMRLIITDEHYTDAHPFIKKSNQMIKGVINPILAQGSVPVVTGYIAASETGNITTLGRGGSDYTAALIGAALTADDVWIFTDVDGVMTADPRLVPNPATVPVCSYREVAELAYYGAKVLHPKTIRPVIEAGIQLRVCNTFNPSHPGTRLVANLTARDGVIKAITTIRGVHLVTLEGRGMLGVPGVAARTFDTVAKLGISVPLITQASSEQSICFAVPSTAVKSVLEMLNEAFKHEIEDRDIDSVWATGEVGIVTVVGEGMRSTPGVAGRVFTSLGDHQVNVIAIAQGSSEVSISLVVSAEETLQALRILHNLIEPSARFKT